MIMIWLWWDHEMIYRLGMYFYMDMMRLSDLWWWLRSTTGSYGRPVIEVAYGEIMFHSTEVVRETLAQEEWLGCRHDTSPMVDIPRSTLVWAQYTIFFGFHDIKIYMYYVLKSIRIINRTLVVSDFVLAWRCSEKVFNRLWVLKEINPQTCVTRLDFDILLIYV